MTREKAIQILGRMYYDNQDVGDALKMAIEALSQPRNTFKVIDTKTGEEADTYEIALHEEWAKSLMYCDMEGFAIGEDGTLYLLDECGKWEYPEQERFKVVWDD